MDIADTDARFTGSIAEIYESHLVPLIFAPYAADLAKRVARCNPSRVLETAAGTGVLSRAMAHELPAHVNLIATDLNQPMLDHAALIGTPRPVRWEQADATRLPFNDASFDFVVCQFGAMFFPAKTRAFSEARRVLRRGGSLLFNVGDRIEENEFASTVTDAFVCVFPTDPPLFMRRTPHGYFDAKVISRDLVDAGFQAAPRIDTIAARSRAATAHMAAVAYCHGTLLLDEIKARSTPNIGMNEATSACNDAIANRFGTGPVDGKVQAHMIVIQR